MTTTTTATTMTTTATDPMAWATPGNLALIVVGVLLIVALLLLISRRRRSVESMEPVEAPATRHVEPPVTGRAESPEIEPAATARLAEPAATAVPIAPAPPPFESSDIPVVATAPFEAAPATLAESADDAPAAPVAPVEPETTGADDFTQMKGVGPKLAARLGDLGYTRYAQIAALTPADAEALDAQLGTFRGRLTRDRWIEQAGYLANRDRAGFEAAFGRL